MDVARTLIAHLHETVLVDLSNPLTSTHTIACTHTITCTHTMTCTLTITWTHTPPGHIQENLEDELVQEALRKVGSIFSVRSIWAPVLYMLLRDSSHVFLSSPHPAIPCPQGLDLRQYSRQIESELRKVEVRSIEDCILQQMYIGPNPRYRNVGRYTTSVIITNGGIL